MNEVRRVGDVVIRDAGPWTPAVHRLLRHLESVGFEGAPRVVDLDLAGGRESLTFVEGDCPELPWASWVFTDDALVSVVELLRAYHEAASTFRWTDEDDWRWWVGREPGGAQVVARPEVVCHTDLWLPNVVFRDRAAAALIDWDFAQPGSRLDDVASAAKHWVPLVAPERRATDGWPPPGDEARRLRLVCDTYGLEAGERSRLLDHVLGNNQVGYESHRVWGQAGVPGFAEMWQSGQSQWILADRAWLLEVWDDLAAALV